MQCEDVMKSDIECVSPQTSIQAAARRMREQNVGFLPVCDEGMRVVGTVTDRDITIRGVADGVPITSGVISLSDIAQRDELSGGNTLRHVSSRESRGYTVAPIS